MTNNHIIEQILASADIVKIIGKYVELKRSGNEYKGCCPFHGEKTPSFYVNPQKNLYNCFGCGVSGNALTFLKDYENMTAGEALKELSRQTGIELPKEPLNKAATYKRTNAPANTSQRNAIAVQTAVLATTNLAGELSAIMPTDTSGLASPSASLPTVTPPDQPHTGASTRVGTSVSDAPVLYSDGLDNQATEPDFDANFSTVNPVAELLASSLTDFYVSSQFNPTYDFQDFHQSNNQAAVYASTIAEQEDGSSSLYDLLAQIAVFYQQQLSQNTLAQQYFLQRGLTQATIEAFALGYAPAGWQHLEQAFPRDIAGLKILGLVRESNKGKDYDLLRNRVIFPIRDNQGRIVGFAGRSLNDDDMPKYINSSDSPIFHKQTILYGLYEGRKAKAKDWLVVEGYMDVISLHQAGVYGAVASMGTAIATSQIERLLQLNPVLTLSFDGDAAGQKAAWRAMEVALPTLSDGKELRFLTLPNNHDPDSFVKTYGKAAMQTQISNAVPMSQYLFSILSRRYDINIAEGRGKLLAEIGELTRKLPKGSYGWLLREDMRQRMGLGKRTQSRTAQDALLNFNSFLTKHLLLQLCFLYQPELLGNKPAEVSLSTATPFTLNNDLIYQVYYLSRATKTFLPKKQHKKRLKKNLATFPLSKMLFEPMLDKQLSRRWRPPHFNNSANLETLYHHFNQFYRPNMLIWQDIADEDMLQLIDWIQQIQPKLIEIGATIEDDFARINAKAHFILAGLTPDLQQKLCSHWVGFFTSLSQRAIHDIFLLVIEILTPMLLGVLNKPIKISNDEDIERLRLAKDQSQTIFNWFQRWQQQKEV